MITQVRGQTNASSIHNMRKTWQKDRPLLKLQLLAVKRGSSLQYALALICLATMRMVWKERRFEDAPRDKDRVNGGPGRDSIIAACGRHTDSVMQILNSPIPWLDAWLLAHLGRQFAALVAWTFRNMN